MAFSVSKSSKFSGARLASAVLLVAVLGTAALSVWARPGGHEGGMHGGPGIGMLAGRGLDRMLDSVNASAEQRSQIKSIAEAAKADMQAQREAGKGMREQMMTLFTQPTVDANAVETLRAQMLQQHDQASRRITQAMLDVSRVLTPEQRQQLAERAAQRRSMMERHRNERRSIEGGTPR
jgi:Spy/CpxP family protein refolding chaperone